MNDTISSVLERKSIAPLVRFERHLEEDKLASLAQGRAVTRDVDFAIITPPYSKDEVFKEALAFLRDNKIKVANGGLTQEQADRYQRHYEAWKNGHELPLVGTPIRGWPVLTPAQQENLIRVNIPTVEYLSEANDEGLSRIGMGALEQKRKAIAWLAQATDKGPLTQHIAALQTENDVLKMSLATLTKQVEGLMVQTHTPTGSVSSVITANDLLGPEDVVVRPSPRKRG